MGNSLLIYLNKRLNKETLSAGRLEPPGPVITISRETGCGALPLAHALAQRLNRLNHLNHWRVLSKEILRESARELNLDPERISKTLKQSDRYTFEEILKAFGDKEYKSEKKIKKTVVEVIHSFAADGFCIIVGRAGNLIASDIKNALHVRLTAPLEYRVKTIMHNNNLPREEAIRFIRRVDEERMTFRKEVAGDSSKLEMFDITINRNEFTTEDIVDLIELAVERKKILTDYRQKINFF